MTWSNSFLTSFVLGWLSVGVGLYAAPIHDDSFQVPSRNVAVYISTLVGLAVLVCTVVILLGCVCCPNSGLKVLGHQNGISLPAHHQGVCNHVETSSVSEFTIFPPPNAVIKQPTSAGHRDEMVTFEPLPDIRPRKLSNSLVHPPRPAHFRSTVSRGLSLQDWFEEPNQNFPRSQLQYLSEVGTGWFGKVVEGEAQNILSSQKTTQVVVKIMREDASPSEHVYFLHEVRPFRELKHPNILSLLGRCLEADPFLIILEHCSTDLKSYLIERRSSAETLLQSGILLNMACNVASALQHMHQHGFIHIDLAARNCLVDLNLAVKIGDYGTAVNTFKEDYYCLGEIALPIRWCAPESLQCKETAIETKEVTREANVWSFGILLWELLELGKMPYMEMSDDEVLIKVVVENSLKLEQPKTPCVHKDRLYQIMMFCWNTASERPSMQKIAALLNHLYDNKDMPSDSTAFEARWDSLQPVVREHNVVPRALDPLGVVLTFENDFSRDGQQKRDSFLSASSDLSETRETSSSRCSLSASFDINLAHNISPSLQNLRGSLEDLDTRSRDFDSKPVKNEGQHQSEHVEDRSIEQQISAAIQDLDNILAGEVTSSETSKDTTPERNQSEEEDTKTGSAVTLTDIGDDELGSVTPVSESNLQEAQSNASSPKTTGDQIGSIVPRTDVGGVLENARETNGDFLLASRIADDLLTTLPLVGSRPSESIIETSLSLSTNSRPETEGEYHVGNIILKNSDEQQLSSSPAAKGSEDVASRGVLLDEYVSTSVDVPATSGGELSVTSSIPSHTNAVRLEISPIPKSATNTCSVPAIVVHVASPPLTRTTKGEGSRGDVDIVPAQPLHVCNFRFVLNETDESTQPSANDDEPPVDSDVVLQRGRLTSTPNKHSPEFRLDEDILNTTPSDGETFSTCSFVTAREPPMGETICYETCTSNINQPDCFADSIFLDASASLENFPHDDTIQEESEDRKIVSEIDTFQSDVATNSSVEEKMPLIFDLAETKTSAVEKSEAILVQSVVREIIPEMDILQSDVATMPANSLVEEKRPLILELETNTCTSAVEKNEAIQVQSEDRKMISEIDILQSEPITSKDITKVSCNEEDLVTSLMDDLINTISSTDQESAMPLGTIANSMTHSSNVSEIPHDASKNEAVNEMSLRFSLEGAIDAGQDKCNISEKENILGAVKADDLLRRDDVSKENTLIYSISDTYVIEPQGNNIQDIGGAITHVFNHPEDVTEKPVLKDNLSFIVEDLSEQSIDDTLSDSLFFISNIPEKNDTEMNAAIDVKNEFPLLRDEVEPCVRRNLIVCDQDFTRPFSSESIIKDVTQDSVVDCKLEFCLEKVDSNFVAHYCEQPSAETSSSLQNEIPKPIFNPLNESSQHDVTEKPLLKDELSFIAEDLSEQSINDTHSDSFFFISNNPAKNDVECTIEESLLVDTTSDIKKLHKENPIEDHPQDVIDPFSSESIIKDATKDSVVDSMSIELEFCASDSLEKEENNFVIRLGDGDQHSAETASDLENTRSEPIFNKLDVTDVQVLKDELSFIVEDLSEQSINDTLSDSILFISNKPATKELPVLDSTRGDGCSELHGDGFPVEDGHQDFSDLFASESTSKGSAVDSESVELEISTRNILGEVEGNLVVPLEDCHQDSTEISSSDSAGKYAIKDSILDSKSIEIEACTSNTIQKVEGNLVVPMEGCEELSVQTFRSLENELQESGQLPTSNDLSLLPDLLNLMRCKYVTSEPNQLSNSLETVEKVSDENNECVEWEINKEAVNASMKAVTPLVFDPQRLKPDEFTFEEPIAQTTSKKLETDDNIEISRLKDAVQPFMLTKVDEPSVTTADVQNLCESFRIGVGGNNLDSLDFFGEYASPNTNAIAQCLELKTVDLKIEVQPLGSTCISPNEVSKGPKVKEMHATMPMVENVETDTNVNGQSPEVKFGEGTVNLENHQTQQFCSSTNELQVLSHDLCSVMIIPPTPRAKNSNRCNDSTREVGPATSSEPIMIPFTKDTESYQSGKFNELNDSLEDLSSFPKFEEIPITTAASTVTKLHKLTDELEGEGGTGDAENVEKDIAINNKMLNASPANHLEKTDGERTLLRPDSLSVVISSGYEKPIMSSGELAGPVSNLDIPLKESSEDKLYQQMNNDTILTLLSFNATNEPYLGSDLDSLDYSDEKGFLSFDKNLFKQLCSLPVKSEHDLGTKSVGTPENAVTPSCTNSSGYYQEEYELDDILEELDENGDILNFRDLSENKHLASPSSIDDSGKYSSVSDDEDVLLEDLETGVSEIVRSTSKEYQEDEVLVVDTETNEAVLFDPGYNPYDSSLTLLGSNYISDILSGPLESIVEESEDISDRSSPIIHQSPSMIVSTSSSPTPSNLTADSLSQAAPLPSDAKCDLVLEGEEFLAGEEEDLVEEGWPSEDEEPREAYTPDFESETDETSSTGTSCSSTSGSFECLNGQQLNSKEEEQPVKVFSNAWDKKATPTKSAIKSPEKSVEMKKSVSFHEMDPLVVYSYPPEPEVSDDEDATEFSWHVDYSSFADWDLQPFDDEEIPEDIIEFEDFEMGGASPSSALQPVSLSTMMYSITGISDEDLDSLEATNSIEQENLDKQDQLMKYGDTPSFKLIDRKNIAPYEELSDGTVLSSIPLTPDDRAVEALNSAMAQNPYIFIHASKEAVSGVMDTWLEEERDSSGSDIEDAVNDILASTLRGTVQDSREETRVIKPPRNGEIVPSCENASVREVKNGQLISSNTETENLKNSEKSMETRS